MSGACSTHGRDNRCIQKLAGKPEGTIHSEDVGVDRRIIMDLREILPLGGLQVRYR